MSNRYINSVCFPSFVRSSPGSTKRSHPCSTAWTTTGHTGTSWLRYTMQRWRPSRMRRRNWKKRKPKKVENMVEWIYRSVYIPDDEVFSVESSHINIPFFLLFLQLAEVKWGSQKPASSAKFLCCLDLGGCNLVTTNLGYSSLFQSDESSSWTLTRLAWSGLIYTSVVLSG